MNGVNRDITFQAIELRIQIEEATIGRPLTEEEKQVYINENKEVPSYKSDSSTLEHFGKMGFLKALNYIEVI